MNRLQAWQPTAFSPVTSGVLRFLCLLGMKIVVSAIWLAVASLRVRSEQKPAERMPDVNSQRPLILMRPGCDLRQRA